MVKPEPADPPPTFVPPATSPRIMSLGLEVETCTLEELVGEPPLLAVAGKGKEGSKGVAVFAPEIPKTINEYSGDVLCDSVTVMVTLESGEEATAHHSPALARPTVVNRVLKVRPLAVGGVPKLI